MSNMIFHIADADGLIAMISKKDASHDNARKIVEHVTKRKERILFPSSAIVEAITTCQVRLADPILAREVARIITKSSLPVIPIDAEILSLAVKIFNPDGSKKNTMFDATIAATAQKLGTKNIFSFDHWYKRLGFTLSIDLI